MQEHIAKNISSDGSDSALEALLAGRLHNPFSYLGIQTGPDYSLVRVFYPYASNVWISIAGKFHPMARTHPGGIFEWRGAEIPSSPYLLRIQDHIDIGAGCGATSDIYDPYAFPPRISEYDLYLFHEGRLWQAYNTLGSHAMEIDGVAGVRFAVWAPNAARVSVVGSFNRWDSRVHMMAVHESSGVWELFIPGVPQASLYKYEILSRDSGEILLKADPYAQRYELRPGNASRTPSAATAIWNDEAWMAHRNHFDWQHSPLNIYEVHAGSWRRNPDGSFIGFRELAARLIPYVLDIGFTHVELLPITEHPLDESWGYQTTGYFGTTSRYGSADDLKFFIDACHRAGLGVILDWVPAHFPNDAFALAHFDGTALYEHADPRMGFHEDWGTHIFNFGRNEVKSFLLSSAHYWLSEFHFDGLRVDAVASMLYLDYSRKPGDWIPNKYGGPENLEAIDFLRELNIMVHQEFPGALTVAEESTAWPAVSRPTYVGGLGFSMKWNMGWMNDTLSYMRLDPVHRRFHHDKLTFGQLYAYTENFVLPLSHDEVVHGKGSLIGKMPGDGWQKRANLRLLFCYQMTWPGKKLNFMGNEFGQQSEWHVGKELDWEQLEQPEYQGVRDAFRDLSRLYRSEATLYELDFSSEGFSWIDCHDADNSVISYLRRARNGTFIVVVLNFTPVPRQEYRIGVPRQGAYRELFNSDSSFYGGSGVGNMSEVHASAQPWNGYSCSLSITLPPLAGLIFLPAFE